MRAWQLGFLFVVVSNAAVQHVMSLEGEELADSTFGEFSLVHSVTFARLRIQIFLQE